MVTSPAPKPYEAQQLTNTAPNPNKQAEQLFRLPQDFDKTELMSSILAVETKKWEKAGKKGDKPTIEAINNSYEKLNPEQILISYATNGRTTQIPAPNEPLSAAEAKTLGSVLIKYEEKITEKGGDLPVIQVMETGKINDNVGWSFLEAKELSAYLQSAKDGKIDSVEEWVKKNNIGLTQYAEKLNNGEERIVVEARTDQARVVANGTVTLTGNKAKAGSNYGSIEDIKNGKVLKSADGDKPDAYFSDEVLKQVRAGVPYTGNSEGKVFVMQQMKDGKNDELKFGFYATAEQFRDAQIIRWNNPEKFKDIEGEYVALTQDQYKELKDLMREKPDITIQDYANWKAAHGVQLEYVKPNESNLGKDNAVEKTGDFNKTQPITTNTEVTPAPTQTEPVYGPNDWAAGFQEGFQENKATETNPFTKIKSAVQGAVSELKKGTEVQYNKIDGTVTSAIIPVPTPKNNNIPKPDNGQNLW
jgi:hypothetical protein